MTKNCDKCSHSTFLFGEALMVVSSESDKCRDCLDNDKHND